MSFQASFPLLLSQKKLFNQKVLNKFQASFPELPTNFLYFKKLKYSFLDEQNVEKKEMNGQTKTPFEMRNETIEVTLREEFFKLIV